MTTLGALSNMVDMTTARREEDEMAKQTEALRSWHVRAFPVELRHRLRVAAAQERRPVRSVVIEAVEDWLERALKRHAGRVRKGEAIDDRVIRRRVVGSIRRDQGGAR